MSMCPTFQVLVMCYYWCIVSVTGDTVTYYAPVGYRAVPGDTQANILSTQSSNVFPQPNHMNQQKVFHTRAMQSQRAPSVEKLQSENVDSSNNEVSSMINSIRESENKKLHHAFRTDSSSKEHAPLSSGLLRQNYDTWTPQPYQESPSVYEAPTIIEDKGSKALPKFNFLEPVAGKMSNKVSGIMELVFTLLGSGSNNFIMKGFKEVIIDGILKPLMLAKSSLKVLISKMTIPLISLLLINVEVLITIWWLWEDCPQPQLQPIYPTAKHTYNAYNTTYR